MKRFYNYFFSLILAVSSAAGVQAGGVLQVVSASPKGDGPILEKAAVSITFSEPVTSLSENSAFAAKDCPLHITPAVEGVCRYSGTQTLQFEPENAWQKATEYTVTLPESFTSRVSGNKLPQAYSWSFSTPRINVQRMLPYNGDMWIDRRPLILVRFSQPALESSVAEAASLTYIRNLSQTLAQEVSWWERVRSYFVKDTAPASAEEQIEAAVPLAVRLASEKECEEFYYREKNDGLIWVFEPKEDLPTGTKITFTLSEKLKSRTGTLPLKEPFVSSFYTYPKLTVSGAALEGCLPFDAHINFSSPVRLGELVKHIKVSPASALSEITEQEAQTLGRQRAGEKAGEGWFEMPLSFLRLHPKETITLTIDKELTDIYGQKLGSEKVLTLTNTGYCPAVEFKGDTGVLESYLPARHPIDVLNTSSLEVRAARFNKNTFIPFNNNRINYCSEAEIAQADLQYNGSYHFAEKEDKTQKTYLDLKKFNPTAYDSIIFSQVRVPSKHRENGYCWVSAMDNITDLGVTLKTSPQNTLVWVTSLQTGEPLGSLNVELKDSSNRTLWKGSTDENGIATAPGLTALSPQKREYWMSPEIYAFVSSAGGDAVLASSWNDGLEPWRFNVRYEYNPPENQIKTALFTDRGIYRPGETVYFKGLTRQRKNGEWNLPNFTKGELSLSDSRGEEIEKKTIFLGTGTGAFDGSFVLPGTAATGSWNLRFTPSGVKDGEVYYPFRVEAVKQSEFNVNLRSLKPYYEAGQKVQYTASADYLFGAPVAEGKVKWTVRRTPSYFSPDGYENYVFTPYFLHENSRDEGGLLTEASGVLDAQGKIDFSVSLPLLPRPQEVFAEAGVEAPSGQQLFSRHRVVVHPASFYLGAEMKSYQVAKGETLKTHLIAVNPAGKPVGPVKVRAKIQKQEYFSIRKNGLSGRLEWVSEKRVKDFPAQEFTVAKDGYDFEFKPSEPGSYQITLISRDENGREVLGGLWFTALGKGEAYWRQNEDDILALEADKDLYQPGDTARIVVKSPYENATALITVEREGVLEAWTQPVSAGADYVEVPIKPNYLPNVFVSITLVRGRAAQPAYDKEGLDLAKPQGKTGYVNLTLSQAQRQIQTLVQPSKENYEPGQEAVVKLNTAVQGKGTAAEVTVLAVDEGVLALTGYKLPDLMEVFYSPASLAVATADNRVFLIGQRNFGEKGENRGGGGGLLDKLGGADLRSHFEFTPYFNGRVRTDAKGRGEVKFKLPDNLTSFRIMAVAATVREFGSGQANIKVSKPLMITPKMPRFARRGDTFACGAVVYNYEDEKGEVTVSARASGAVRLTGAEQKINVSKGEAKEVSWPCEAVQTGTAEVAFAAHGAKSNDGVLNKLTVSEVEKAQTLTLYAATDKKQEQLLDEPASVNPTAVNEVKLSLASTALLNLRGGMLYLLTYPYDCLEQKMSKIRPVVEGAKLIEAFGLGDVAQYKQKTQTILNEMAGYQSASGGYGYWPDSQPDPYVTAYALETAYRAKQAGYKTDTASLNKAVSWLKGVFDKKRRWAYPYSAVEDKTVRAYAVYVLALYGQKLEGQFNNLYVSRNGLSVPAQAYLLLSAKTLGKDKTVKNVLAQELLNQAAYGAQTLHFSADAAQPWLHMSEVKVTALVLEALLQSGDYLAQPYQAVKWLTDQLNAQGHWNNTNTNAAVFGALNTYYTLKESAEPNFKATASVSSGLDYSAQFKGRTLNTYNAAWPFSEVYADDSSARVMLKKSGSGTLYYTLSQVYTPLAYKDSVNAGFAVSRRITDLKEKPVEKFKAGERYKVILKTVSSASRSFVVLEDFIPAGFELVNTSLATESAENARTLDNGEWGGFTRDEKYDDRITVFADYLSAGTHEYSYLVQASITGSFSYPSVWAEQMYEPAVFGRSATSQLVIER